MHMLSVWKVVRHVEVCMQIWFMQIIWIKYDDYIIQGSTVILFRFMHKFNLISWHMNKYKCICNLDYLSARGSKFVRITIKCYRSCRTILTSYFTIHFHVKFYVSSIHTYNEAPALNSISNIWEFNWNKQKPFVFQNVEICVGHKDTFVHKVLVYNV